ncbi:hypothetical protein [Nonomuraea sp. NPDC050643]|uniref:hypothetical protein n=1 Tax=Nonomuraea sp. NPDC050643 TaxID=3155660 RepID=UPI0033D83C6E
MDATRKRATPCPVWPGDREFQILHITPSRAGDGAEFTITDEAWPLVQEDEAFQGFQAKVAKDVRG